MTPRPRCYVQIPPLRSPTHPPGIAAPSESPDVDHADSTTAIAALLKACRDGVISWSLLQSEATYASLLHMIQEGFPLQRQDVTTPLLPFWGLRDRLSAVDGVALKDSRTVIPAMLRARVLNTLHSAHQRMAGMKARARLSVYTGRPSISPCGTSLTLATTAAPQPHPSHGSRWFCHLHPPGRMIMWRWITLTTPGSRI